jgi:hypothetical protein
LEKPDLAGKVLGTTMEREMRRREAAAPKTNGPPKGGRYVEATAFDFAVRSGHL